jgi:hypothetical protein
MGEHNQSFPSYQTWASKASSWLTRHHRYDGKQFRAICFDAKGRLCTCGADFMRADKDGAFPVRWLWPDQVGEVALGISTPLTTDTAHFAAVDHAEAE